jgi:predicted RNase H-like nuclease (RuvC/YqgF family)
MLNVNPKYENDILQYCKLNNIEDVSLFVTQCFKQGFDIKKYGFLGKTLNEGEKHLKTEVIVEKRIEIPVEVIKEVPVEVKVIEYVDREIIKEVPVEKIVTKIEYISDKTSEDELLLKIQQLEDTLFHLNEDFELERQEFSSKTQEMEKNFQDRMSNKIEEVDKPENKMYLLQETLQKLRKENNDKNSEIQKLNDIINELELTLKSTGAVFMKSSNMNDNL